ncbi:MAG: toxin-antitoxin system HicB family antitoxin, partial [Paracoccaceae bacterium]|nr:toxin-antitoxin system HicB family antitoxin [Paracoccaceae bacterium]
MTEFDATRYSISVRKEDTEDGELFVARVAELPDIEIFEESADEAYSEALEVICAAKASFDEDGEQFPEPVVPDSKEYSGRIPVRMAKWMHKKLAEQAE